MWDFFMMHFWNLLESIATMLGLVVISFWLKKRGVLQQSHYRVLSRLVTDFALPALILLTLSQNRVTIPQLIPSLIMVVATFMSLIIGWVMGKYFLRLPRVKLGSFIMVCGFGSSSTLGYTLISQIFPGNNLAISQAMLIGEFGAAVPFFTLGVVIASYFGARHDSGEHRIIEAIKTFLFSPIFLSVVLGVALSFLPLPFAHPAVRVVYSILKIAGNSLESMVALSIGLMFVAIPFKRVFWLVIGAVVIKLLFTPMIAFVGASLFHLGELPKEVLLIEAAMPSGAVAALLAARYGCHAGVASMLTIATYILSLLTLPLVFWVFGT